MIDGLTAEECEILDSPDAYLRAVELGYVRNYFEYRSALRAAKASARMREAKP